MQIHDDTRVWVSLWFLILGGVGVLVGLPTEDKGGIRRGRTGSAPYQADLAIENPTH